MTAVAIYHADALEVSADDFAEFDCMITDPPYSAHVHANPKSMGTAGAGVVDRDLGFEPLSDELREAIALGAGSVKRWSAIFSDIEGSDLWRLTCKTQGAHAEYIRAVPWVRWSQPQLSGDRPPSGCEMVSLFHSQNVGDRGGVKPKKKHWNGPGSLTHFSRRAMRGADKHKAQKPLDLMLDLVSYFSDPGEDVIDPCAGAGTTILACRLLGRNGAGLELNEEWAEAAQKRATGRLSPLDRTKAAYWVDSVREEARKVAAPKAKDGSDVRTWERAQRRLADADRVEKAIRK